MAGFLGIEYNIRMKYLAAIILFFLSCVCFAAIYLQTDPEGNVVYSDTPGENATTIVLPNGENNISIPKTPASSSTAPANSGPAMTASGPEAAPTGGPHKAYTTFLITDPSDQATFQNQRDIPVTIKMDPPLQEGDKVQLYVDGLPSGPASGDLTQLAIHQVDRGQHQLSAAILDAEDHVLNKTDNLTFFIHYSAIPTGSNAISPTSISGNGVTPSSPGSGVTTPASEGAGIVPSGSGVTPSGSGVTPSASGGSGIVPPARYGSGIMPGR